jgi:predicted amidohydrolase
VTTFRVAAAQWPIEPHASLAAWGDKLERWIAEAAAGGAQLAVMPEYAPMELTSVLPAEDQAELERQLHGLQALLPEYLERCRAAARAHGLYLVAGSFPEAAPARFVNRLRVWSPGGDDVAIEKLHMTRFEREQWGVVAGAAQRVVETSLGVLGVAICYDSEFPLTVRRLVAAGAQVVLVPSCTDTPAGYHRVRVACAARALENQCYLVQSPTVGAAPWSLAADDNYGAAGVFVPPDRGFPDDGVLTVGPRDVPLWVYADLDLDAVDRVQIGRAHV